MNHRKSGFALVVALSLMAFVLLLVLSLVTFIRVETATANVSRDQLKARMNAQLAVMLALGDLQKYAGADQRVTATADILVAPDRDPITDLAEGSVKWTGVWASHAAYNNPANIRVTEDKPRSYTADETAAIYQNDLELGLVSGSGAGPTPQWLVSGDNPSPTTLLSDADSVVLVSVDEDSIAQDNRLREAVVRAPLSDISDEADSLAGQFAYWVGDEGVKARVNQISPYVDARGDAANYEVSLAQAADPSVIGNSLKGDQRLFLSSPTEASKWKSGENLPSRLSDRDSLVLVSEVDTADDGRELRDLLFHDVTTHSSSLITNTKHGGFKKDLTLALDSSSSKRLQGPIFPPLESNAMGDPGGPRWEQLADYYNFSANNNVSGKRIDLIANPKSERSGAADTFNNKITLAPVVTKYQMVVQMFSQRKATADPASDLAIDYDYYFGLFPLVTLWNPYDHAMNIGEISLYTEFTTDVDLVSVSSGSSIGRVVNQWKHADFLDDENRPAVGFTIRGAAPIPAGKSVTFTPAVNSIYSINSGSRVVVSENVLTEGTGGDLINGFFIPAVDVVTDPVLLREDVGWSMTEDLWTVVSCVYAGVNDVVRIPAEDKFISMMHPGFGAIVDQRVIDVTDLVSYGVNTFDFGSFPSGATAADSARSYDSPFDFDTLGEVNGSSRIWGFTTSINFPESPLEPAANFKSVHLLSQMNPRAPMLMYGDQSFQNDSDFLYRMYSGPVRRQWESDTKSNFQKGVYSVNGNVGMSTDSGPDQMILYEVPNRQPLAIGDLMNANLLNVDGVSNTMIVGGTGRWNANFQQPFNTPTYAIGSSFANIHMPLGSLYRKVVAGTGIPKWVKHVYGAHYDYSYLLNDQLWDDYFFSTNLDADADPEFPLPNSRIVRSELGHVPSELTDADSSAANLMIEGGFNINSTSVAAWSAVIGAMRDIDSLGASQGDVNRLRHNYSRFGEPEVGSAGEMPSYDNDLEEIVSGFRFLTDEQVVRLATSIVHEIKARRATHGYPFLSLSDFINRSIDAADVTGSVERQRFAYLGVLQHAIDQSELNGTPGVNDRWEGQGDASGLWDNTVKGGKSVYVSDENTLAQAGHFDDDALQAIKNRPYLDAAPGSFSQADLLAKIGSFLTPRSDTFTIRGYGQSPTGFSSDGGSEAYCEITVQRTPVYCNDSQSSSLGNDKNDVPANLSEVNLRFGRKFKVVSFRWLGVDDI